MSDGPSSLRSHDGNVWPFAVSEAARLKCAAAL